MADASDPAALIPRSRPPRTPRGVWILALVLGGACAVAFVVSAVRGGDAPSAPAPPPSPGGGSGFSLGLLVGALAGLALGWFAHAHSSRNKP